MKQTRREFVRSLFIASQAAVATRFLPENLFAEPMPDASALKFLVVGDWGRGGEPDQMRVAIQMGKTAATTGAKFIVSVGDNFYEDGVHSTQDKHWKKSFEDVYSAPSLQVPWYVILGNHDYHGDCDAQIAYSKISSRWNMPARYFSVSKKLDASTTADFFFLDTTPLIKVNHHDTKAAVQALKIDPSAQLAWFKSALAASTAQWKLVFGHHPIYSGGDHGDTPELMETLLPLLREHKVQAYFNGHDHDLQHLQAGGIDFFCSGAGSQIRPTRETTHTLFAKGVSGFMTVALQPSVMQVVVSDSSGAIIYKTLVRCVRS